MYKKIFSFKSIFGIILTILFIFYLYDNYNGFKRINYFENYYTYFVILLRVVQTFISAQVFLIIIRQFKDISFSENLQLNTKSLIGNLLLPYRAGSGYRGLYLRKYHGVKISHFSSIFTLLTGFSMTAFLVLLGVFLFVKYKDFSFFISIFVLFTVLTITVLLLRRFAIARIKYLFSKHRKNKILSFFYHYIDGFNQINSLRLLFILLILHLLLVVTSVVIFYCEFKLFGLSNSFPDVAIYTSLIGLSNVINITPAALGLRESVLFIFNDVINIDESIIIQMNIFDRIVNLFSISLVYVINSVYEFALSKQKQKKV